MNKKKLCVRIYPNGKIETQTLNIKGKKCNKVFEILENLLSAKIIDSSYTAEYYEKEETILKDYQENNVQNILLKDEN